jgi:hypothetical protein
MPNTLTLAELPAALAVLNLQSTAARGGIGNADFLALLASTSGAYSQLVNPQMQDWMNQLYTLTSQADAGYAGASVGGMHIVREFTSWAQGLSDNYDAYEDHCGLPWQYDFFPPFVAGTSDPQLSHWVPWRPPPIPPGWASVLGTVQQSWIAQRPAGLVPGSVMTLYQLVNNQNAVMGGWTTPLALQPSMTPLYTSQAGVVGAMLAQPSLSPDEYVFLLHVLLTLGAGPADCQTLVRTLVNTPVSTDEYPNDTFINQLVYLTLLRLADPLGGFAVNNAGLQGWLSAWIAVASSGDAATTVVRTSLANHLKVAQVDASYPMQDPYAPSVGFMQRQTNVLYALDQARAGVA